MSPGSRGDGDGVPDVVLLGCREVGVHCEHLPRRQGHGECLAFGGAWDWLPKKRTKNRWKVRRSGSRPLALRVRDPGDLPSVARQRWVVYRGSPPRVATPRRLVTCVGVSSFDLSHES